MTWQLLLPLYWEVSSSCALGIGTGIARGRPALGTAAATSVLDSSRSEKENKTFKRMFEILLFNSLKVQILPF